MKIKPFLFILLLLLCNSLVSASEEISLYGLSGNQSISVPNGSSYVLNITNNQFEVWELNGRTYQNKTIATINGSMVTTETNIPLQAYIEMIGNNGSDIAVSVGGVEVPKEVESNNDVGYNVSTFYKMNTTADENTEVTFYHGNATLTEPAADSTYGSQAVWDENFKGVWHMAQVPSGGAGTVFDSTSNANHGTSGGSMTTDDLINGVYGKGIEFDGVDDKISADGVIADTDLTQAGLVIMEMFMDKIYCDDTTFFGFGKDGAWTDYLLFWMNDGTATSAAQMKGGSGTFPLASCELSAVGLHYHAGVKNGEDIYYYLDGSQAASDTTTKLSANIVPTSFDIAWMHSNLYALNAKVYEVRISSGTIRSDGYFSTTSNNLINPTSSGTAPFYLSIGEPQEASGISNITASISSDSDTQSYNTSQSREFTLTPTGTTNEVVINTTCTDYDIIIITETVPVGTFLYPNSTNSIGYYGRLVSELVYSTGFNVSDIGSWNLLSPACMEVMSTYDSNCVQSIDQTAANDGYMHGNFSLPDVETVNFINIKTVHHRSGAYPVILGLFNVSTQKWHAVNNSSVETVDVEMTYNITGSDIANYTTLNDNVLNLSVSLNTNSDGNYDVYVDFVEVYIDYEAYDQEITLGYVYNLTLANQDNVTALQKNVVDIETDLQNMLLFTLFNFILIIAVWRRKP